MLEQINTAHIALNLTQEDNAVAISLLSDLKIDPSALHLDSAQIRMIFRSAAYKGVTETGKYWCIVALPYEACFGPSLRHYRFEDGVVNTSLCAMEFHPEYPSTTITPLKQNQHVVFFRAGNELREDSSEYKVSYDVCDTMIFTLSSTASSKWLPNARTDDEPWDSDPYRLENSCSLFRCLEWTTNHKTNDDEDAYVAASELFETVCAPLMGEVMRRARGG